MKIEIVRECPVVTTPRARFRSPTVRYPFGREKPRVARAGVSVTNILLSPDFQRLRTELMRALERHPEARAEVAAVFRRAGLQAAAEMGAPASKIVEAQPAHVT